MMNEFMHRAKNR